VTDSQKAARIAEIETQVSLCVLEILGLYEEWEQLSGPLSAGRATSAQMALGEAIRNVAAEVSAAKSN
jgi:hypothetical protein